MYKVQSLMGKSHIGEKRSKNFIVSNCLAGSFKRLPSTQQRLHPVHVRNQENSPVRRARHPRCEKLQTEAAAPGNGLYSFSNLLYGWSLSLIRPYFLRISSCLSFLSIFRSSACCLISSLLLLRLSSSLLGRDRHLPQERQQQQQQTPTPTTTDPPRTPRTMTRASKFIQHTPHRAWDSRHTDGGGSSQLTGYSVQLLLLRHHRHWACGTQVSQSLCAEQGTGGAGVTWHSPWLRKLAHSTAAQSTHEEVRVRPWVKKDDMV